MRAAATIPVREALARGASLLRDRGVEDSRLEAGLLVERVLEKSRTWLLQNPDAPIPASDERRLRDLLEARATGEPLAYLLGAREFYGRSFVVDNRVLIPRQETEDLVEQAIAFARWRRAIRQPIRRVVDVGTGSGVIAVSLALELPEVRVWAVDFSAEALAVTRINAARHLATPRIALVQSDLLRGLGAEFDLLVANLPYVPSSELDRAQPEVRREPRLALDGGPDGLDVYRRFLADAPTQLAADGALFFEIAHDQGVLATALARQAFPGRQVRVLPDLAGHDRIVAVAPMCYPFRKSTQSPRPVACRTMASGRP